MKQRCFNSKSQNFSNYGGRGITVCQRWANSFKCFFQDMGCRPTKQHSLDRINNDGNYEPSNCRWATKQQQSANRRGQKNNKSRLKGVTKYRNGKYMARVMINYKTVHLGYFNTAIEASVAYNIFIKSNLS